MLFEGQLPVQLHSKVCGGRVVWQGDPLRLTLVLRWKAVEVVFAVLNFSLQVFRYSAISAMSDDSICSTVDQLLCEYRSARSSAYPYC